MKAIITSLILLISLYVDDKTPLPESEQYVSVATGQKIKTIGNKWSDLETSRFKTNSQPYYVLIDHDGKMLASPRGYDSGIEGYSGFLKKGIRNLQEKTLKPGNVS